MSPTLKQIKADSVVRNNITYNLQFVRDKKGNDMAFLVTNDGIHAIDDITLTLDALVAFKELAEANMEYINERLAKRE